MTNALPSLTPVLHEIHGSGDRMIGFTLVEDGDLALRIEPSPDGVVVGAHALAEALAEANRLLALSEHTQAKGTR